MFNFMEPLVSVITPTYNSWEYIEGALRSVLGQSYGNLEIIVVDDGSTRGEAAKIVRELAEKDRRVRYFRQENLGQAAARNRGVAESRGEFIALIDDDDEWVDRNKLKKQIAFLENNPDYVLVGSGMRGVGRPAYDYIPPQADGSIRSSILFGSCFINSSTVFRKEAFQKIGGYKPGEQNRHVEDYDLWLRLGTAGKMANLPEYLVKCRLRPGSDGGRNLYKQQLKNIELIKRYRNVYPGYYRALLFGYARIIVRKIFGNMAVRPALRKIIFWRKQA